MFMETTLSLHIGHDATAMFIDDKDYIAISGGENIKSKKFLRLSNKSYKNNI